MTDDEILERLTRENAKLKRDQRTLMDIIRDKDEALVALRLELSHDTKQH